mgnify:CR=1 FL=1
MSLKSLAPRFLTSRTVQRGARAYHSSVRTLTGGRRTLHAFLQAGDPASQLFDVGLEKLEAIHDITIVRYQVGAPDRSAAPDPERLAAFAIDDSKALSDEYDLPPNTARNIAALPRGEVLRKKLGHYASASACFEGEWYTGLERLHHLETRLGTKPSDILFPPPGEAQHAPGGSEVEAFISFRSPYSYLVAMRMFDLAERWGATLIVRPVLPMVMRGLSVPREKRFYIVRDAAREASRLGLPFGNIVDPVGAGVERALAVFPLAREQGCLPEFVKSGMAAAWADGLDLADDRDFRRVVERAGLSWSDAQAAMGGESWRREMDENRVALNTMGLWGVPSFRVGEYVTWGQDRLWRVGRWLGETIT